MPLLQGCDNNLVVLIETFDPVIKDWSFIYSIVDDVTINYSNSPHQHAIPFQTEITDHVQRNMDTITITGVVGCNVHGKKCNSLDSSSTNIVVQELKRLSERSMYCKEQYVNLTSNDWLARNMILTSASINERQDRVHTKAITTTWIGANLVGNVGNASFTRGGIVI